MRGRSARGTSSGRRPRPSLRRHEWPEGVGLEEGEWAVLDELRPAANRRGDVVGGAADSCGNHRRRVCRLPGALPADAIDVDRPWIRVVPDRPDLANVEDRCLRRIHERAWPGHIGAELHRKGAVVTERDGLVGQVADADVLRPIRLPTVELEFDAGSRSLAAPNPVRLTASDRGEQVALIWIVAPGANAIVEHPTEGVVGISQQMLFEPFTSWRPRCW